MKNLRSIFGAFALFIFVPLPAQENLELGRMWTFEKPPLAYLGQEYGFAPDEKWLNSLRMASLRFGNWCSASFVSPKGLIMTNHHCMRDNVSQASPPDADWVKNGFVAAALEDEVKLAGLTVQQLVSMTDVTDAMQAGIEPGDDAQVVADKRKQNEQKVLADAKAQHPENTAQVVELHQGAVFRLYLYKVYDDIRLVCAPHLQTAHFGGDPDNFTYPRYSIDFGFVRAYEDGKPADTSAHYFRWSRGGAKEGELVFVTGNPGSTGRLLTKAQMEYMRDAEYPVQLDFVDSQLAIVKAFAAQDARFEQRMRPQILNLENTQKAFRGYHKGLLDPTLMQQKEAAEAAFRAKVMAKPELAAKYGDAWDELAAVAKAKTELFAPLQLQVPSYSRALARAVAIVNAVDESADQQKRDEATKIAKSLQMASNTLYAELLKNHLTLARKWLGPDDPYIRAIFGEGEGDVEAAMGRLADSTMRDQKAVEALLEGGAAAVAASEDPAIAVARVLVPLVERNRKAADEIAAKESVLGTKIGLALFAVYGDGVSPDATMTLRFSDGVVRGYPYNGTLAPWRTVFHGLYARNIEFGSEYPFSLPEPWLDRKDAVDMSKSVCFVSTNDIIGGNSGSPVVNRELEVVGLIFDGNIEQLSNRFVFRERVERSVSVHVDAIVEALAKIYDAGRVLAELTGEKN